MRVVLLVLLAGCNQLYSLDDTKVADAPPPPPPESDIDGDGVPDIRDNCPNDANPNQHDEDLDTRGDVCDNCPLIPNGDQARIGDDDPVGDACDPNPIVNRDCLVVFDSFVDPSSIATHWTTTGEVTPAPDSIMAFGASVLSNDARDQAFSVQVTGSLETALTNSSIAAISSSDGAQPHACGMLLPSGLDVGNAFADIVDAGGGVKHDERPLSQGPILHDVLLRLSYSNEFAASINCRTDYGYAVGVVRVGLGNVVAPNIKGFAGIQVVRASARLGAIAIYSFGQPCGTPIYR